MYTCPDCNTTHDTQPDRPEPTTLVDRQCFNCGTVLTQEQIDALTPPDEIGVD